MSKPLVAAALALGLASLGAAVPAAASLTGPAAQRAELAMADDVRRQVDWVRRSGDAAGLPFVVIDKRQARLWLFDAGGALRGHSAVLLGLARGDHSVPGIGERPMAQIQAHERTTPAGRFVVEPGRNLGGEDIFWIDYDAAVSMHRVRATNPLERRLQRLATPTPDDNRISYGCVNVPVDFYDGLLAPLLRPRGGVAYLLPETRPQRSLSRATPPPAPARR